MMSSPRYLTVFVGVYLVFLYAPVVLLPLFAFNDSAIIAFPLKGFSLRWFEGLQHESTLIVALKNSLIVALSASVLSTCFGVLAARAAARYDFLGKKPMMSFLMLPLVLPEIIVGVALLIVLVQLGIELNVWTVILGHVLICMPFSIAILLSAFNNMDKYLEEASLDLGATRRETFFRVILPLVMPGLISSLLIGFTLSLDEFIIAFFLTGTEPTLPVYIWSQLRFPSKLPGVMALGFIMLVLSLILLTLGEYYRKKSAALIGAGSQGIQKG
ncbi:ABC transporter permease [Alphaproteobacteria bacterium LSUCC0684]